MDDSVLNSAKSFITNRCAKCVYVVTVTDTRKREQGIKRIETKTQINMFMVLPIPLTPYIAGISLWMTEWFCIRQTNNWHLWNVRPMFGWYAALICSQVLIFAFTRRLLLLSSPRWWCYLRCCYCSGVVPTDIVHSESCVSWYANNIEYKIKVFHLWFVWVSVVRQQLINGFTQTLTNDVVCVCVCVPCYCPNRPRQVIELVRKSHYNSINIVSFVFLIVHLVWQPVHWFVRQENSSHTQMANSFWLHTSLIER